MDNPSTLTPTPTPSATKHHLSNYLLAQPLLETSSDMPSPPAYDTIVDPNAPIPNLHNPYDPDPDLDSDLDTSDDLPEITVNASTQIRGHANIISTTPMDASRIAGLLYTLLHGSAPPTSTSNFNSSSDTSPSTPTPTLLGFQGIVHSQGQGSENQNRRIAMPIPRINITVNCGATIVGNKNIVGPSMSDIARSMQAASRNRPITPQAAQATQGTQGAVGTPPTPLTPPMSRNPSESGESGGNGGNGGNGGHLKRKAEEEPEGMPEGMPEVKGVERDVD